ncbi:MAG: SIS domain-containing protein [Euzebyales bacterium]|nr:SIS domain-containing protein [Euzebyales bacterium]
MARVDDELAEQPEALARLIGGAGDEIAVLADRLRRTPVTQVVIAARGSSDNAARYAQYVFGGRHRLPVALAAPSLHTLYEAPPTFTGALVIGISQSGQSPDIVRVLADARAQGCPTLALTNEVSSPLASTADHVIDLRAGPERAVAATKTYTNSLGAVALLSAALSGRREDAEAVRATPERVAAALALAAEHCHPDAFAPYADAMAIAVIGRGYAYSTAHEIALKIKELTGAIAAPYSAADLLHGPIAAVRRGLPVFLVAPSGRTLPNLADLVEPLRLRGARLLVASDDEALLGAADTPLPLPAGPEWLAPAWATIPGQVAAIAMTRLRGDDPDAPLGLSKVTHTV